MNENGLYLKQKELTLQADLTGMLPRLKQNNLGSELLVRAAKSKHTGGLPTAVDATAGFGEDALLLAAAGFSVELFEYNPVIAALLADALERASFVPELKDIVNRMHLTNTDSVSALSKLSFTPDVILLDPMFPARQKSALVKKKFQLIHYLEQPCTDEASLLQAAMGAKPKKIIIKRPAKGPFLAGIKPGYSIQGRGIRYDCIVNP